MTVASLPLCKELYELSGWEESTFWFNDERVHAEYGLMENPSITKAVDDDLDVPIPAYDLGYLLRKLPAFYEGADTLLVVAKQQSGSYWASYHKKSPLGYFEDTPEDAVCKLAIELFKQGILTKG